MNKRIRFAITFLAAMLCMAAFASTAYADAGPDASPAPIASAIPTFTPTASPNPFTPDGTGTVLDAATGEDGKEFYTILTPDEHVFYLVIDQQRNTENVYFLDAVTEKDLLSLAQVTEEDEGPAVFTPTPQPTPQPTVQPEQEQQAGQENQNNVGDVVTIMLIVAVMVGGVFLFFKLRKPKQSIRGKTDLDEYDFGEDEEPEAEAPAEPETEDEEQ